MNDNGAITLTQARAAGYWLTGYSGSSHSRKLKRQDAERAKEAKQMLMVFSWFYLARSASWR